MGFMGAYLYADGVWSGLDPKEDLTATPAPPWMYIHIFDSDITTVRYEPHGAGSGVAFLGSTPRHYFDDPAESAPTDPAREAEGLAAWATSLTGSEVSAEAIRPFLAGDDDEDQDFDDDTPDADIFVELKTAQLLSTLAIAPPADLRLSDAP